MSDILKRIVKAIQSYEVTKIKNIRSGDQFKTQETATTSFGDQERERQHKFETDTETISTSLRSRQKAPKIGLKTFVNAI